MLKALSPITTSTSWLEMIIACIAGGIAIVVMVIYFHEKQIEGFPE